MQGIKKVKIEAISIKDPQDGQWGQWWSYGIKVNDEWWNGSLKSQEQVDAMQARKGQEVELFFFVDPDKDPKYANRVRFITDKDRKEAPKEYANDEDGHKYQSPEVGLEEAFKRIEELESDMSKVHLILEKWNKGEPITDTSKAEQKPDENLNDEGTKLPF